jgi:hypothetical protein
MDQVLGLGKVGLRKSDEGGEWKRKEKDTVIVREASEECRNEDEDSNGDGE